MRRTIINLMVINLIVITLITLIIRTIHTITRRTLTRRTLTRRTRTILHHPLRRRRHRYLPPKKHFAVHNVPVWQRKKIGTDMCVRQRDRGRIVGVSCIGLWIHAVFFLNEKISNAHAAVLVVTKPCHLAAWGRLQHWSQC